MVQNLRLAEHAPGVGEQVTKQVELGRRQVHELAAAPDLVGVLVKFQVSVGELLAGALLTLGAPKHGAHTGDDLLQAEGLGDVVVGADGESAHTVVGVATRRQEDDRQATVRPVGEASLHLEPVQVRKHDVEQHQVGAERFRRAQPATSRGAGLDLEALVAKRRGQQLRDAVFVVHDQHTGLACGAVIDSHPDSRLENALNLASDATTHV